MTTYKLKKLGYAWIDNVAINDIDCIEVTEEMINIFRGDKEVANAIKGDVDIVGYYEYDERGYIDNNTRRVVYEY